jgi:hypothetical protein
MNLDNKFLNESESYCEYDENQNIKGKRESINSELESKFVLEFLFVLKNK